MGSFLIVETFETNLKSLVVYMSMWTRLLDIEKAQMVSFVHDGGIASYTVDGLECLHLHDSPEVP